jgi:DNA replication protein DnaC
VLAHARRKFHDIHLAHASPTTTEAMARVADQAIREKQSHIGYLEALLGAEIEERERNTIERRIREAHLPRVKTLEEFDYTQSPQVTAAKMRDLGEGGYIDRAEPVLFIGECGTGKTHLLTGLCVAACRQKCRVRFITAAGLLAPKPGRPLAKLAVPRAAR